MQEKMTKLVDAGHAVSRLVPAHAFVDMLIERNDWPYGICNRLSTAKHAGVLDPNLVVGNQLRNDEFKQMRNGNAIEGSEPKVIPGFPCHVFDLLA